MLDLHLSQIYANRMTPPYCVFLGRIDIYAIYRLFHSLFTISKDLLGQKGQVVITRRTVENKCLKISFCLFHVCQGSSIDCFET